VECRQTNVLLKHVAVCIFLSAGSEQGGQKGAYHALWIAEVLFAPHTSIPASPLY
jgi:hypothetical protein